MEQGEHPSEKDGSTCRYLMIVARRIDNKTNAVVVCMQSAVVVCPGAKRLGFPYNDNAHVRIRLVSNK